MSSDAFRRRQRPCGPIAGELPSQKAAVHRNDGSGRILRGRRAEKDDRAGDIVWLSPSFERGSVGDALVMHGLSASGSIDGRLDVTRRREGPGVCTENLNPNVMVMKSAQEGV
jgi:hypothetical protein